MRNNWGARQIIETRLLAWGNKASKPLTEKICGVEVAGETTSLTREFVGETHRVLGHTERHTDGTQHEKGPIFLWVEGEVTES